MRQESNTHTLHWFPPLSHTHTLHWLPPHTHTHTHTHYTDSHLTHTHTHTLYWLPPHTHTHTHTHYATPTSYTHYTNSSHTRTHTQAIAQGPPGAVCWLQNPPPPGAQVCTESADYARLQSPRSSLCVHHWPYQWDRCARDTLQGGCQREAGRRERIISTYLLVPSH